jgi:hypothetical protein
MKIAVQVTYRSGHTLGSCWAVYYSTEDETILWRWDGAGPALVARAAGNPEDHRLPGRNHFAWPDPESDIVEYQEAGCGCSDPLKRHPLRHPDATGHAHREHAR